MSKALKLFHQHKNKLFLMKISSLQVISSFFTSVLILQSVGLGGELDVFYIGMSVFAFLYSSVNWSISSILAPYLIDNRDKNKEGALFVTVAIMVLPIAGIIYFTMPFWIKYLYVNYLDTVEYSKIVGIQSLLILAYTVDGFILVFTAMLQEKNKYITFNMAMLVASIFGLVFVYFSLDTIGVYAAAINQLIMKSVILIIMLYMFLPHIIKTLAFDKEQLKLIFHRTKYLFLGSIYFRTDEVVERYVASYLTGGFVSLISFAQRVYGAIITVLNSAIGLPSITAFSNFAKEGKYQEIREALIKYIFMLLIISLAIFIFMFYFGEWLFLLIIQGNLTEGLQPVLHLTILCLFVFVLTKPISLVLQSLLLALKKGTIATVYDSVTFTINVILKVGLTIQFGMYGLLASIVIGSLLTDLVKMHLVFRELNKLSANKK